MKNKEVATLDTEDEEIKTQAAKADEKKLYCVITNTNILETGLESECVFDQEGGSIGTSTNSTWVLTDYNGNIYADHCSISYVDNQYRLIDHSGKTCINYSKSPMEFEVPMVITPNDIITIGPYNIKLHSYREEATDMLSIHKETLESMFPEGEAKNIVPDMDEYVQGEVLNKVDPLLALGEKSQYTHVDKYKDITWNETEGSAKSDYEYHMDAPINDRSKREDNLTPNKGHGYQYEGIDNERYDDHLATGPIMRGLQVRLSHSDHSGEMQYVAEEVGASLRETIKGLLKLHHQVSDNHYGLMNKNFQPIVDNPLRMGLTYEETVHLMYDADVSLVHLAPPAAINESLQMIKHHQEAVHEAISDSLSQILNAFSPDALMQRFNYYRSARRLPDEDKEAWAWKMYRAYHLELISNRQTGFKKLFWEIFDQVYDKKMRTLQEEGLMNDLDENQ